MSTLLWGALHSSSPPPILPTTTTPGHPSTQHHTPPPQLDKLGQTFAPAWHQINIYFNSYFWLNCKHPFNRALDIPDHYKQAANKFKTECCSDQALKWVCVVKDRHLIMITSRFGDKWSKNKWMQMTMVAKRTWDRWSGSSTTALGRLKTNYSEVACWATYSPSLSHSGLHKLWDVLISRADRGSCAHKCVC